MRRARVLVVMLLAIAGVLAGQENRILLGPGFEKGQASSARLSYVAPEGWVRDVAAEKETGLMAILLPKGRTLATTERAITVAFQRKDPSDPTMADLKGFFRADMEQTLAEFPDLKAERWQPAGLDAASVEFMSIEFFSEKGEPSPQRLLMLDSGDGFFSLVVTVSKRAELNLPEFARVFDSVRIEKPPPASK